MSDARNILRLCSREREGQEQVTVEYPLRMIDIQDGAEALRAGYKIFLILAGTCNSYSKEYGSDRLIGFTVDHRLAKEGESGPATTLEYVIPILSQDRARKEEYLELLFTEIGINVQALQLM